MKLILFLASVSLCLVPTKSFANSKALNVAVCSQPKSGYSYYANSGAIKEKESGWREEKNLTTSITLKKYDDNTLDLLYTIDELGTFSIKDEGATIIPVSLSEKSFSFVVIYPNKLSSTYAFQKLNNGKYELMWTESKIGTAMPKIATWVSDCSYVNLSAL
jgi:hypothetical protein